MSSLIKKISALTLLIALASGSFGVHAASPDEDRIAQLQAQIEALEREAATYRTNIAGEQVKAASLKRDIGVLQSQISTIQTEIAITGTKIDKTKIEISTVKDSIGKTQEAMSRKRETIGRMVAFLDQRDRDNTLATLLKYPNLSDFLSQLHDAGTMQSKLLDIVVGLKEEKADLQENATELASKQDELEDLAQEAARRKAALDGAKSQKDQVLRTTKGQEALYQKQLAETEKKKAAFFKEMRELELKVISGGLYIVHLKADSLPPKGTKLFAMPESKGRLTQGYGMTAYARRGAYGGSPHNGIDISSGFGSPIMAIGDGQIVANGTNSGWGNWVAIAHANNMVSVYGHMSSLSFLKVGSKVKQGDVIGYEGATGNATGSHVHLSIYREFFTYLRDKDGQLYFNYFEGSLNPLDYL